MVFYINGAMKPYGTTSRVGLRVNFEAIARTRWLKQHQLRSRWDAIKVERTRDDGDDGIPEVSHALFYLKYLLDVYYAGKFVTKVLL